MFTVCYAVLEVHLLGKTEIFICKETSINIVFIYNKLAIKENLNRVEITHTQIKNENIL